ncbi:response regulator transcription factor [Jiulongibacter sediminis]|jgi:DNA-binding response OmpR family regulator|uniref:Transcriptional regulator n=1 Tax=Jiulongibacter sediminis TaxID=1605367 RepID=A0A0P7C424_9BACT|nr:response regulator transcription factor [Jiulongibacter sediminis]KPM49411.1 transcriptional regulator [Jiulongibacter sediminis]TBX26459.1 transcriptional regulator [Jiulongibacter sediminis]
MFVKNKQILIIEDDQRIAETISKGLQEQGMTTQVAYDGKIGAKYALSGQFDLILLDLNLPQLNGYQVAEIVRKENTEVPILMLTALGETEDKVEGFEKGADDYLVKPFDFRELLVRIKSLLRRSKSAQEEENHIVELANLKVDFDAKLVFRDDQPIQLTPKEFGLLEYLVKNQGKVVSKAEIAEAIWDQNASQSLNVIEVYINFLRKKIDKDFEPKVIHTKSGMGYVMRVE